MIKRMGNLSNKNKRSFAIYGTSITTFNPADGVTYCLTVNQGASWGTVFGTKDKIMIPIACTIKACRFYWYANGVAGSSENIQLFIRKQNTTDYLVAEVATGNAGKNFQNEALNIPLISTDYFEFKLVCPTWATNPAGITFHWIVYIE